jgi:hypothetical protein
VLYYKGFDKNEGIAHTPFRYRHPYFIEFYAQHAGVFLDSWSVLCYSKIERKFYFNGEQDVINNSQSESKQKCHATYAIDKASEAMPTARGNWNPSPRDRRTVRNHRKNGAGTPE